jgi:hypothetical protein
VRRERERERERERVSFHLPLQTEASDEDRKDFAVVTQNGKRGVPVFLLGWSY